VPRAREQHPHILHRGRGLAIVKIHQPGASVTCRDNIAGMAIALAANGRKLLQTECRDFSRRPVITC
jgi:hypothetical protein